jgi:hypothetical protein
MPSPTISASGASAVHSSRPRPRRKSSTSRPASPELSTAQIRDLAELRWLAGRDSVVLYGPVVITGLIFR